MLPWQRPARGRSWQVLPLLVLSVALTSASLRLWCLAFAVGTGSLPWSVASWNQHRKSSYKQKDCIWIKRLGKAGLSRDEINKALDETPVQYSPLEIQSWMYDYDVVAVQEADPLLAEALDEKLRASVLRGGDDRDGRGELVESASGLILNPERDLEVVFQTSAVLKLRLHRGKTASRDHLVALVRRESDGELLVFCSVHLHPKPMVRQAQVKYLDYLRPLRLAIQEAQAEGRRILGPEADGEFDIPLFLTGDFNIDPDHFGDQTATDDFWGNLEILVAAGGDSAHASNPAVRGDFALSSGGIWTGRSLGCESFAAFERYADLFTRNVGARAKWRPAKEKTQYAMAASQEALRAARSALKPLQQLRGCASTGQALRPALSSAGDAATAASLDASLAQAGLAMRRGSNEAQRSLAAARLVKHRKGLLTSDHRPTRWEGFLEAASSRGEGVDLEPSREDTDPKSMHDSVPDWLVS
eukprot:TRINITY_DN39335_c0_g1_i1.p1 TRINITY_DN39335_c0_g1~~TRINITY_DN39335_c0_g1_i1.p1  ORF type:complete len:473 (-),score=80.52 TRINITY_DN39335_c0_g1_i1:77-1495(-)